MEVGSTSDTSEEEGGGGDLDQGLGDIDALLVVPHEASPARHPSERSLHDPIWTIGELVDAALAGVWPEQPKRYGRLTVVEGGRR